MIRYKKTKRNPGFFLICAALIALIFFSHRNPETSRLPSNLINMVLSPINGIFYSASQSVQDLYDRTFGSRATQAELDRLTLENKALEEEVRRLEGVVGDEAFLRDEYALRTAGDRNAVPAVITMQDPSSAFVQFTIDKGTASGVGVGDIVLEGVSQEGQDVAAALVGQVKAVGPNYATVSSVLDQTHNISVLFSSSQSYGIINKRDGEQFYGYLLDATVDVALDEEVLTSGIGGRYPRGLYLGHVSEVTLADDGLTKTVTIQPAIDFSRLYRVLVVPGSGKADGLTPAKENQEAADA
ncbi:MAG: rod shape-determining protein MreC [Peptoniphilaceae bacterium]|nr:rod shape-determining protein MreC [Peptoniphilaceae bacterium]MDY6085258.1 rod shape-determining protein MreC [Peptoniphilaceae bacterium]